mmetsp:Transcript_61248/g.114547  ORF Transcript_61248/g.114547 Transcript_61248/m.114547 type:complete len:143 (+) Transcript_61248:113-541(+)
MNWERTCGFTRWFGSVIGVLRANPEFIEMLVGLALRQDLPAPCAELSHTRVASQVVIFAFTRNCSLAPWTWPCLLPLSSVKKLRQEARFLGPGLPLIDLMDSLVPSTDFVIVEEAALTGGKMVIPRDLFPAAPTKVDFAARA